MLARGPSGEAVTGVRDVQSAVDELGASLAHPVLVEDARHRPIWWSAQGQVDGTRMRTILQHEVDPAAAAVVVRLGLARARGPGPHAGRAGGRHAGRAGASRCARAGNCSATCGCSTATRR